MTGFEPVSEERRLWKYIIFGFLTLGIYDLIFMWRMFQDLNRVCGNVEQDDEDRSPNYLVFILLSLITFGIYSYVWYYKQGNRMKRAASSYNFEIDETGSSYVLWTLFGILLFGLGPIIALYLFICNMNKLSKAYNYRAEHQTSDRGNILSVQKSSGQAGVEPFSGGGMDCAGRIGTDRDIYVDDSNPTISVLTGTIECISGDYEGARISIVPGEELIIGRSVKTSQIILQDKDISRTHCSIRFNKEDNMFYVTDLSTYESTYLNDTIHLKRGTVRRCPLGSKLTLGNGKNQFILK